MNTDYKEPIFHQSDYRTSQSRAHRFLLSAERNLLQSNSHILCEELRNSWNDYRPKSESAKEFEWKINRNRNVREHLAMPHDRVHYTHQFSDKIKAMEIVKPIHNSRELAFQKLPREVKPRSSFNPPPVTHTWLENSFTNTPGYYKFLDGMLTTTDLDYHQHKNSDAQTKLIPRVDLPFNSNVAFFIPKSHHLIKQNPMAKAYTAKNTRDILAFKAPSYDRITVTKVPYRGLESEMKANY